MNYVYQKPLTGKSVGGDFGTWYDVLEGNLGFDAETIQFLDF